MGIPIMCCIKYLVFFLSMVLAVIGTALIVIGSILISKYYNYTSVFNEQFSALPYLTLLVGLLLFLTSFFGCCGVLKDNHCFLTAFASFLLVLLLLGVVGSIITLVFEKDIRNLIKERMDYTLSRTGEDMVYNSSWNIIQWNWKCCGRNGPSDWNPPPLPSGCCFELVPEKNGEENKTGKDVCLLENAYKLGCLEMLDKKMEDYTFPLVLFPILLGLLMVIFSILALNHLVLTYFFLGVFCGLNQYGGLLLLNETSGCDSHCQILNLLKQGLTRMEKKKHWRECFKYCSKKFIITAVGISTFIHAGTFHPEMFV